MSLKTVHIVNRLGGDGEEGGDLKYVSENIVIQLLIKYGWFCCLKPYNKKL